MFAQIPQLHTTDHNRIEEDQCQAVSRRSLQEPVRGTIGGHGGMSSDVSSGNLVVKRGANCMIVKQEIEKTASNVVFPLLSSNESGEFIRSLFISTVPADLVEQTISRARLRRPRGFYKKVSTQLVGREGSGWQMRRVPSHIDLMRLDEVEDGLRTHLSSDATTLVDMTNRRSVNTMTFLTISTYRIDAVVLKPAVSLFQVFSLIHISLRSRNTSQISGAGLSAIMIRPMLRQTPLIGSVLFLPRFIQASLHE